MYNEEAKKEFIERKKKETVFPTNYLEKLFENVGAYEDKIKKNICDWNDGEVLDFYRSLESTSGNAIRIKNSYLSQYCKWAISNNVSGCTNDPFQNMQPDVLMECADKEKLYNGYITTRMYMSAMYNLINPVDKFIFTCLWEGIFGKDLEDIWKLKLDDIHKSYVNLPSGGRKDVDVTLYNYAHESANTYVYHAMGKKLPYDTEMFGSPDQIIKEANTKQVLTLSDDEVMRNRQKKNIFRKVNRAVNFMEWEGVSPRKIMISGQMTFCENLAKQHNMSTKKVLLTQELRDIIEKKYIKIKSIDGFLDILENR